MVIVPTRPGPLVRPQDLERGRDEIDELLDEVFGTPDERGPGAVDAALVVGGAAAVVSGLASSLPAAVTVGGAVPVALGAVLPTRSLWRRLRSARRSRRLRSFIGDGTLLRTDHLSIERLLAVHGHLLTASATLATAPRGRVHAVAHSALVEVASVLAGGLPGPAVELEYIEERTRALVDLADAVRDPRVGDGESRGVVRRSRRAAKSNGSLVTRR